MKFDSLQTAVIDFVENGTGSAVVEAVAGAGKTTVSVEAAKRASRKNPTYKIAMVVYNKKNGDELVAKIAGETGIQAGTVHSFGMRAIRKAFGDKIKVDSYKLSNIIDLMKKSKQDPIPYSAYPFLEAVTKMVSYAKQRALGVMGTISNDAEWQNIVTHFDVFSGIDRKESGPIPEDALIALAKRVLTISNKLTDVIDFDDMVYLPTLLGLPMFRFDIVFVDEAQDTNPARRALVRALVKSSGRVIAVGDRRQAIYGFTGADNDSLDQIKKDFNAIELPLTVSYRCPKAVVTFARQWVSHITSADTAPEGLVSTTTIKDLMVRKDLNKHAAILSRVTAPLVELAFKLLRAKIACKIEGRDVGAGLKKLVTRWKIKTADELLDRLETYSEAEKTKALAKKNETKAQQIDDTCATIQVIVENVNAEGKHLIGDVVAAIDSMFSDDVNKLGILTLSTIHKAKGREWERVFWLNRTGTCPSKYARQKWQMDQEHNLMYVAATRAKVELYDLTE